MADESENIEARLAAYIDGEMAAGDRRDIEDYLAANPSHAKLIADLREQRAGLAGLPHEKAPAEIMDHLQQHLERHALLGEDDSSQSMRVNHWPQWTAVAAMLLLAAGLGLLVYQVLPGGGRGEQAALAPMARDTPASSPPIDEGPTTEKSADGRSADGKSAEFGRRETENPADAKTESDRAQNAARQMYVNQMPATNASPLANTAANPAANTLSNSAVGSGADQAGGGSAGSFDKVSQPGIDRPKDFVEELADNMVRRQARKSARQESERAAPHATLTVFSDDPAMTGALVAQYLVQNGITFDIPAERSIVDQTTPSPAAAGPTTNLANAPATMSSVEPGIAPPIGPAVESSIRPSTGPSVDAPMESSVAALVLHNVTAGRARELQVAFSAQRAGRQRATLEFAPPLSPYLSLSPPPGAPATQRAESDAEAIAILDRDAAAKFKFNTAPAGTQPTAESGQAKADTGAAATRSLPPIPSSAAMAPATQAATQPAAMTAAPIVAHEPGDMWIVIRSTAATQPAIAPAFR